MSSMAGETARPAQPSSAVVLVRLTSVLDPLDLPALFGRVAPVEVDLGSGDGGFLLRRAPQCPERDFLAAERLLGRVRKLERKAPRLGITNIRAVRVDAAYLARHLLVPGSVHAFHIYFPDPWPKKRHRRRRLVNAELAVALHRALAPGGAVYLRTDDADYFAQMEEVFAASPGFARTPTPPELLAVRTDFEEEFLAQGKATLHAAYRKTG
jgi:tRNA (guanine-N7-)-methyltransferase